MTSPSRAVALIDMDCFYCACERALNPDLAGVPLAVVQYNPFQGDGSGSQTTGIITHGPEPALARIVYQHGKLLMPSASNGSIIAVSSPRHLPRFTRPTPLAILVCCTPPQPPPPRPTARLWVLNGCLMVLAMRQRLTVDG